MRVLSVNVSGKRPLEYGGRMRQTGIFKEPVSGAVAARRLGLDGDVQVDKRYHGGPDKAVYSFASEDLASWKDDLGALSPGAFGENLTTEGLDEAQVRPGDVLRFGGAVLQAASPRLPCRTLAARYQDAKLPKRFLAKGRFGIYWRVLEEGPIAAGDAITVVSRVAEGKTIPELGLEG